MHSDPGVMIPKGMNALWKSLMRIEGPQFQFSGSQLSDMLESLMNIQNM